MLSILHKYDRCWPNHEVGYTFHSMLSPFIVISDIDHLRIMSSSSVDFPYARVISPFAQVEQAICWVYCTNTMQPRATHSNAGKSKR